jgi:internalin A
MKKIKNMWKMATMVVIFGLLATMLPLSALGSQAPAGTSENVTVKAGEEVNFPDPNLEAAIRDAIDKPEGPIYPEDLEGLTELHASEKDIADLTGLEYCTNLEGLYLRDNQISDISPLSGLTSLWCLDLDENQISDISPLSSLTNLEVLCLWNNQISDISPLSGLTNLRWLDLGDNQITDISPLSGLTNLEELDLGCNQISDISPLSGLTNLKSLDLGWNQISDIKPLVDNVGLSDGDWVYLYDNPLSDTSIEVYIPLLEERGVEVYW